MAAAVLLVLVASSLYALVGAQLLTSPSNSKLLIPVRLGSAPDDGKKKRETLPEMNQPIRIFTVYADNVNENLQDKASLVRDTIIPDLLTFLQQILSVAPTGPILINNQCSGGSFFKDPNNGGKICAQRCVETLCGPYSVPTEHLKQCRQCNTNAPTVDINNCVVGSPAQDGPGVADHDFILYITAVQSACPASQGSAQIVAFATACQTEDRQDRPVAGVINFCPDGVRNRSPDFAFALTKHELLHALVFARGLFPLWRDSMNMPRTPRLASTGLPMIDSLGSYEISTSTIMPVTYNDWVTRTGRISHSVVQLVTPAIRDEARRHFNCSSLQGVELENQGGEGTSLNHFEKRVLGNDAMTGQLTFNPLFSRFTYAALEDSGWYRVNYSLADELLWGKNAGCRFAQGSCAEWIATQTTNNQPLTPFCNDLATPTSKLGCTVDREAVSRCNLNRFNRDLPAEFQFFSDGAEFGGSVTLTDYCPFQEVFQFSDGNGNIRGTTCSVGSNQPSSNLRLETYGSMSRCVNHGNRWTVSGINVESYGSGCYQYNCTEDAVVINIAGRDFRCSCSQANLEMSFTMTVNGTSFTGSILCPSCAEICATSSKFIVVVTGNSGTTGSGTTGGGNSGSNPNRASTCARLGLLMLALTLLANLFLTPT